MLLKGYTIKEQIHNGPNSAVFKAVRQADDKPVIIKTMAAEHPSLSQTDKFRNQFDITRDLNIPGTITMYELVTHQNGLAVIMDDINGTDLRKTLKKQKTDVTAFLHLAIKLTGILQDIHENNIIHKDIKPDNIIVTPGFEDVRIIDFSISTRLSQERQYILSENTLEGTLSYISPEQTGRMNRVIDYRTDFYSLGITFYELLTGMVPFKAEDTLGIVHMHIAAAPPAPTSINPAIPGPLSDIIMKLLSKNAEDRYKSALGIKKDLEYCREQFEKRGKIDRFSLAGSDYSARFLSSDKLYGRKNEISLLLKTFEKITPGGRQMLLVSGYPGIGKSALIHEIYKPTVKHRGLFISGKFDQLKKNIPYSALIQAFDSLINILLTKSDSRLARWKKLLLEALGDYGQVIMDVIPALESILGKQPPVPKATPIETQARFKLCFQKFTRVFARKAHPLTIFLDDLQWADNASLNLIETLITDRETESFLVLGAYRDNEVSKTHRLIFTLEEIKKQQVEIHTLKLGPLEQLHVNQLLSDSLQVSNEKVFPLSALVYQKTKGNPFFVKEFIQNLYKRNILTFEYPRDGADNSTGGPGWRWEMDKIKSLKVTDNVADLLVHKIQELPEDTKSILKTASCIGNRFALALLVKVCKKSREYIKNALAEVMNVNFIFLQGDIYFFSHDRVQEAVYSLITGDVKKQIHYKIGNMVLSEHSGKEQDKNIFYIADQLNETLDLIKKNREGLTAADVNLRAALKAIESTAYEPAYEYITAGLSLADPVFEENKNENVYRLTLALHREGAHAAFLLKNYQLMESHINAVLNRGKELLDKIGVYKIKLQANLDQGKNFEVIATGITVLKELGITLPENPSFSTIITGYLKTRMSLSGKSPGILRKLPVMTDRYKISAMEILNQLIIPCYYSMTNMLPVIAFKMIELTLKYGNSPISSHAYINYSIICNRFNDFPGAQKFGDLAIRLARDFQDIKQELAADYYTILFVKHRTTHLGELAVTLLDIYKTGMQKSYDEITGALLLTYCEYLFFSGKNTDYILKECRKYSKVTEELDQKMLVSHYNMQLQLLGNITGGNHTNRTRLKGEFFDEDVKMEHLEKNNRKSQICTLLIYDMLLNYLFGEYSKACEYAEKIKKHLESLYGLVYIQIFTFYHSLSLLALYPDGSKSEQKSYLKQVGKNQKKLKEWAKQAPMNHLHKYYLVEAECSRVIGKKERAMDYYEKAIELAGKNAYINEQAICYECAAQFYLDLKKLKIAGLYMTESRYLYSRWGGTEKVKQLGEKYPRLFADNSEAGQSKDTLDSTSTTAGLDIYSILKASQAIAGEIEMEKLLKIMMNIIIENAGADRGILLLEKQGGYFIEAEVRVGEKEFTHMGSIRLEEYQDLSVQTVNYVLRSKESFVTGEAVTEDRCADDEYVKNNQIKSLLCFPVIHHQKLPALLYLENNLAINAFTPERLAVLSSLSSQIAVSLENAKHYETQKEKERLKKEMEIAEKIQTTIVPKAPLDDEFEIALCMKPTEEVGGDYYDILYDRGGALWLAIGDVTGHGLTAGLIMMMAQSSFATMLHNFEHLTPEAVITFVNRLLHNNINERLKVEHYMTMTILKHTGEGNFLHAGAHLPILIYRKETGTCELFETNGLFLGWIADISHTASNAEISLNKGDIMLLYTDGITEARNKETRKFLDFDGLQELLIKYGTKNIEDIRDGILKDTLNWCGKNPGDDITMIVVKRKE